MEAESRRSDLSLSLLERLAKVLRNILVEIFFFFALFTTTVATTVIAQLYIASLILIYDKLPRPERLGKEETSRFYF